MARVKQYEAMFLLDSAVATSDFDSVNSVIRRILEKAGAEIISIKKWDERKLAYDIKGVSRGTYILCYMKAPADKIHQIEREVQLSEKIMRVLILKADHLAPEDMEKQTPAMKTEESGEPASTERVEPSASPRGGQQADEPRDIGEESGRTVKDEEQQVEAEVQDSEDEDKEEEKGQQPEESDEEPEERVEPEETEK